MLVGILVLAAPTVGFIVWARSLRRRSGRAWLTVVAWLVGVGLAEAIVIPAVMLARAFRAIEQANPSEKATQLATSISQAMLPLAIHVVVLLLALVVLSVVEVTARARR
jgi:hypothetical protein